MRPLRLPLLCTSAALLLVGLLAYTTLTPGGSSGPRAASAGSSAPAALMLAATVRDFRADHPDFGIDHGATPGPVSGMVPLTLGSAEVPTLQGGARHILTPFRDAMGRQIAAHLAGGGADGAVQLVSAPTLSHGSLADTFNSELGAYGGSNRGPAPSFQPGSTMPALPAAPAIDGHVAERIYAGNAVSVLSGTLSCDRFAVRNNHRLRIQGDVVIRCTESFSIVNRGEIEILPGGSLTLHASGTVTFDQNVPVNVRTPRPAAFAIHVDGAGPVSLSNAASVYATVIAPGAPLSIGNNSDFHGRFTGHTITVANSGGLHIDAPAAQVCGSALSDPPGTFGEITGGGVTSEASFADWFRTKPGTNLAGRVVLTLHEGPDGVYEYRNGQFYPIDRRLFGNDGEPHNRNFTLHAAAKFTFESCAGQFVEFEGADDAWVYIGGHLAIDAGGLRPMARQRIDLDRLPLVDGESYLFELYFAQRNRDVSHLHLRTNVPLTSAGMPPIPVSAGFD